MDIQSLEASDSKVTGHTAEALFTVATEKYDVDFGNGDYGYCFQIGEKYFWLAPVEKANYGEPKR
jgi:hypothetical protein